MPVTTTTKGVWVALTGTLQEVVDELSDKKVPPGNVVNILHNGTTYVALYHR